MERYLRLMSVGRPGGWLLDVGCGDAARAQHFPGKSYVGLDAVVRCAPSPRLVRAYAEAMPFVDAVVDVAICVEVLDHVLDPWTALAEAQRVIAPGGALFLFVGLGAHEEHLESEGALSEEDVHLHHFEAPALKRVISPQFASCESTEDSGYLALFAWERLAVRPVGISP